MKNLVFVVGGYKGGSSYYNPFAEIGEYECDLGVLEKTPERIRLAVFTGGEDVSPHLYKDARHHSTYSNIERDNFEITVFNELKRHGIPMVGICRGFQFLNVMAGGRMIQDVNGHSTLHTAETFDGAKIKIRCTHHQMCLPPKSATIMAWSSPKLSDVYRCGVENLDSVDKEVEGAFFPNINAFGFQWHPEMQREDETGFIYAAKTAKQFIEIKELV